MGTLGPFFERLAHCAAYTIYQGHSKSGIPRCNALIKTGIEAESTSKRTSTITLHSNLLYQL